MFNTLRQAISVTRGFGQLLKRNERMFSIRPISTGSVPTHNKQKPHKEYRAPATYSVPFLADLTTELKTELDQFMTVFPLVLRELSEYAAKNNTQDAATHFEQALQYNVPHGKKIRGLTAVIAYKKLLGNERLTAENVRVGHLLGWCLELLQSVFLMTDDMIDCSDIRRNKLCWHKLDNVQSVAVNDSLMIENSLYILLKQYFSHLSCYIDLFELFHETTMMTTIGQSMDFQISRNGVLEFTMDRHRCISDHKTSHFAFYTPIASSMLLAGYKNPEVLEQIKSICFEMGHFYQVQNDFLDCFSEPDVLKKPGTDIEDSKCTWLAVLVMERGTEQQQNIMKECYGKKDADCINKVKQVYNDLAFPEQYSQYEEETYNFIHKQILEVQDIIPQSILLESLDRTFNRS